MKHVFIFLSLLFIHNVYADPIDQDVLGGCDNTVLNTVDNIANLIPAFSPTVYTCSAGQFLPADTTGCQTCPSGYTCPGGELTFNENNVSGIDWRAPISNSAQYTCSDNFLHTNDNNVSVLIPVFSPTVYNCSVGQFLPADTTGCQTCPSGYTCPGGTYTFNENNLSGLDEAPIVHSTQNTCSANFLHVNNNNVANLIPVFEQVFYNCALGYYLPADSESCEICPSGYYCVGGTYTFNETNNQGIEPCADGTFTPGGTSYCYEHILHIDNDVVYLKSTKTTTPSLNIGMDDGIFFANMTTVPTRMNSGTERYLKIEYDGVIYYVCDDTTYGK